MFYLKDILNKENMLRFLSKKILKIISSHLQYAEFCLILNYGINVSLRNGVIDFTEVYKNKYFKVKVYHNKHIGVVNSTNFNISSILTSIKIAKNIACYTSKDIYNSLPEINILAFKYQNLNLLFPYNININFISKLLQESEFSGLNFNNKIFNSDGSNFHSSIKIIVIANTYGMISSYNSSIYSLSTSLIAKDFKKKIMQRDFEYSISRNFINLKKPNKIGEKAAINVISRLGAKKINTIKTSVLISSRISEEFFLHLAKAINGINVYKKSTFLLNYLGKKIFPYWLSIKEIPNLYAGLGSKPFDMEGIITKEKYIVKNGILSTWLLDSYSANRLGLLSTGNFDGICNWLIMGYSNLNLKNLLKNMHRGLFITEFMGNGINIMNGDYSRGVFGYWVDNGIIQYPVSEVTISGNLKDFFSNIQLIGNDYNELHKVRSGSILLDNVQISGL